MPIITFLTLSIAIIWSIIFLPASFVGVRIYKVSGTSMNKFIKTIKYSSIWNNDEPDGWVVGYWFLGYMHIVPGDRGDTKTLWLLCSKSFHDTTVLQKEATENTQITKITYWTREGCFWRLQYNSRMYKTPTKVVTDKQASAIETIMDVYRSKNYATCLLYGPPGGKKSWTALFLCAELLKTKKGVHLCDTHAPYEHGDNFDSFYNKINPTEDFPLVLVFEEVDGIIMKLHNGLITQGQHNPVQIKNKTDWNSFLDKFDKEMYPNVILLMTSNKTCSWFDELDSSYFRAGRVDLKIEF